MKKNFFYNFILLAFWLSFLKNSTAQNSILKVNKQYFAKEKERVDKIDGKLDGHISVGDSAFNKLAEKIYFSMQDSLWQDIETGKFIEEEKAIYRDYVYRVYRTINSKSIQEISYFQQTFTQLHAILTHISSPNLINYLQANPLISLNLVGLYNGAVATPLFLNNIAPLYPQQVIDNYSQFEPLPYSQKVLETVAKSAPQLIKKYFIKNSSIWENLKKSTDDTVKIILKIHDEIGKKSNAFSLLDTIAKSKLSFEKADEIFKNKSALLQVLINSRKQKNPLGVYSLDQDLEETALKFVREMNELHNDPDEIRFKNISAFTPAQLYTLIVYSEDEIFTSTFNGTFKRLLLKLGKQSGYALIENCGENRFRTFVKQCASFGKLKEFLNAMTPKERQNLIIKFASDLDNPSLKINQAVEVADAFASITDSSSKTLLQQTIKKEFDRVEKINSPKGKAIYGLLLNLLNDQNLFKKDWFQTVTSKYKMTPLDKIPNAKMFEKNKTCIWQMYFYDDDDGDISFKSFIHIFNDKNWKITPQDSNYVVISSVVGKPISIYANFPKAEYTGQPAIEKLFDSAGIIPDVLIHRGHSYYANKTIDKIQNGTKIFVLGSCGGYNSLSKIIEKAADINIVSSKQIGTHTVNNALLKALAEPIREGNEINWDNIWKQVDAKLKGTESYSKFLDYIPPHKNLGAIFIKAYNNLILAP